MEKLLFLFIFAVFSNNAQLFADDIEVLNLTTGRVKVHVGFPGFLCTNNDFTLEKWGTIVNGKDKSRKLWGMGFCWPDQITVTFLDYPEVKPQTKTFPSAYDKKTNTSGFFVVIND